MTTKTIALADQGSWNAALATVPHSFAHTHAYQAALARERNDDTFLFVYDSGEGRAVCPFTTRTFEGEVDIYSPYGFAGFTGEGRLVGLPAAFRDFGARRGFVASYTLLHPLLVPATVRWPGRLRSASKVYAMPIDVSDERNLARSTPRRQERIRRWRRRWARIEDDQSVLRDEFVRMYPQHKTRVRASSIYDLEPPTLRALTEHADVFLLGARDEADNVVSVAMFSTTGAVAEYLFLVQTVDGRRHSEGLLLEAFKRLAERGLRWLHLGGGIRPDDGVAAFKRRFGAHAIGGAALHHIFAPEVYASLCRRAGVDLKYPFFPRYHAPRRAVLEAA